MGGVSTDHLLCASWININSTFRVFQIFGLPISGTQSSRAMNILFWFLNIFTPSKPTVLFPIWLRHLVPGFKFVQTGLQSHFLIYLDEPLMLFSEYIFTAHGGLQILTNLSNEFVQRNVLFILGTLTFFAFLNSLYCFRSDCKPSCDISFKLDCKVTSLPHPTTANVTR